MPPLQARFLCFGSSARCGHDILRLAGILVLLGTMWACDDGEETVDGVVADQSDQTDPRDQTDQTDQNDADGVTPMDASDGLADSGDATADGDAVANAAPEVVSTMPDDGAVDVARAAPIRVVFDRPIDETTLDATTFALTPTVTGNFAFDPVSLTATFQPNRLLDADTDYTVDVAGVEPAGGGQGSTLYQFAFTTGSEIDPPVSDDTYESGDDRADVSVDDRDAAQRTYTITTTADLRDDDPPDKTVTVPEQAGQMTLRSGNLVFDALFALAIDEARQNSVSQISDFAFNDGQGVPCECFETGAKWNYVWTRDTAYAVDLGLAIVDPTRARQSLDFKLSERKGGGDLQIVQDTGSGGSYPVSTDRVVWAIGAWQVLKFLDGNERTAFRDRSLEALKNTLEQDRIYAWDPRDGLYRGEQSFLDWREQSYPSWTAENTVHIAMSKTLSTNVGHYTALRVAAALADEAGDATTRDRYSAWADDLAAAINTELWLDDVGLYSAMKTTALDPAATYKYDLLGLSLAILEEVAPTERAQLAVETYPHGPLGPPVLWPQQPLVPIYHNRGIWPFVTAYSVLAARAVRNDAAFDDGLSSLVHGAALNLSNMENFEFLSHEPWVDDGDFSGPVVNSRRQLWSVAGYIGAIVHGVFGLEASQDAIRFQPFVTRRTRTTWFGQTNRVELRDLAWRGHTIDVVLHLPANLTSTGALAVDSVVVDGDAIAVDGWLTSADLQSESTVEITLADGTDDAATMTRVLDDGDFRRFWAPKEPAITSIAPSDGQADGLVLGLDDAGEQGVQLYVYRDGVEVAGPLDGTTSTWTDTTATDHASKTYCYAVESAFESSGNRSHHSQPTCWWGGDGERIQRHSAYAFRPPGVSGAAGATWSTEHGWAHYEPWGDPGDALEISHFVPHWTGEHLIQLAYGNGAAGIDTGITAGVKRVLVERRVDGTTIADGIVVMPQRGAWSRWGDSSFVRADLVAGEVYRVRIEDATNMSYFTHFEPYTAAEGGGSVPFNRVNVAEVRVLPLVGTDETPTRAVRFDGVDDLNDIDAESHVATGAPLQPWSAFGFTWDDEALYLAIVSEAFEQPFEPFVLYLETTSGSFAAATPSTGIEYSGLTPELPFTPNAMITLRQRSWEPSSGEPPWNAVWEPDGQGGWQVVRRLEPAADWYVAGDRHTLSARIPRAALGSPSALRIAGHVVHAQAGNEWKELVPAGHTPWAAGGGDHYEIDLGGPPAASNWQ